MAKRIKFPQEEMNDWIAKIRARHEELLAQLRENAFLLEAAERHAKPLSPKKLEALRKLHEQDQESFEDEN